MERIDKCELLKEKGYTYNPETGKVYGMYGKEIKNKNPKGYTLITGGNRFKGNLYGHHYGWYWVYGNVDFIELDHKDTNQYNNRIDNLRISNRNQQNENRGGVKGCYLIKKSGKWRSYITINYKQIFLGNFNTEEEAHQSYLNAKQIYHIK